MSMAAVLSSSLSPLSNPLQPSSSSSSSSNICCPTRYSSSHFLRRRFIRPLLASQLYPPETFKLDKSSLVIAETVSDDQLWAAACLRIRSFNKFRPSPGIDDHKKYLAEREFEALKERVAGKREGFRRVSCINATVPLSQISTLADDLFAACKFTDNGEDRVVIGTLDLNQCVRLPDEITGKRPQGIGADFLRAYLSNVCVVEELHRNGLGYALIAKSKMVAQEWGITDLYVHFAVDNEPAKQLYMKSGFIYENDEPAWQARFLDRPRRILLWTARMVGQQGTEDAVHYYAKRLPMINDEKRTLDESDCFMTDVTSFASGFTINCPLPSRIVMFDPEERSLKEFRVSHSFREIRRIFRPWLKGGP